MEIDVGGRLARFSIHTRGEKRGPMTAWLCRDRI